MALQIPLVFFGADDLLEAREFLGLGLAIARDVVRSHGGEILLGTAPMGGLRAQLRLPV